MKKKIYKFVSVAVIAVVMVVSFQMSKANSVTTLTMENIEALAMADDEYSTETNGNCCASIVSTDRCEYNGTTYYASKKCD